MPTNRCNPGSRLDGFNGSVDGKSLFVLVHMDVLFPTPTVGGYFVAIVYCFLRNPWREGQCTPVSVECRDHPTISQSFAYAPPSDTRPIFEMALHAEISLAFDEFNRLVYMFVALITHANREFCTLFHINDK